VIHKSRCAYILLPYGLEETAVSECGAEGLMMYNWNDVTCLDCLSARAKENTW
jgi:hypothetical protein